VIRTESSSYPVTALSHPGMSGKNNEDRFAVSAYQLADHMPMLFAVLADGIGGHRAGEVAAEMAVDTISEQISLSDGLDPLPVLRKAIESASDRIRDAAYTDFERNGMGSTCAAVWLVGYRLFTASVGDSRIYLIRKGRIQQLNIDHTWVQEAIDAGVLTREEVANHPNAHVIRRYLGSLQTPQVDLRLRLHDRDVGPEAVANQGAALHPGDRLVLCTDGLTDLVNPDKILSILESQPQDLACQTLINLANQAGGHDNITLIAITIPDLTPALPELKKKPARRFAIGCLVLLAIVMIAAGAAGGWLWLRGTTPIEATTTPTLALDVKGTLPQLPAVGGGATATLIPLSPSATPTQRPLLSQPLVNGSTLTPWPTNTTAPLASQTLTPGTGKPGTTP
jgi:PPM family protein phosphatase